MIKRTFIGIAWAVGGVIALVLICLGILAWRLTAGPVSLAVLTPVMEMALSTVSEPLSVSADDTILKWNRSDGTLEVRLVNARASSPGDEVVVRVPELSVGLNAEALLRGDIVPTEIEVVRPDVRIVRLADANPDRSATEERSGAPLSSLMSALAEIPGPESRIRGLENVRVVDGTVDVEDGKTGISWRGSLHNTRVWRGPSGINAESFLSATSAGQQSDLAFTGEFSAKEKKLSAGLSFNQIRPAMFAPLGPSLNALAAVDLPVGGTLGLLVSEDGTIADVDFDFLGGVGHVALPLPVAQELGVLAAAQRVAVRGLQLKGTYKGPGMAVDIDRLSIDLEPGSTVYLPAPLDHHMPLSAIRARGGYAGDAHRAELASLELDLDGPEIEVSGTADGIGTAAGLKVKAEITARNIKTNDLARYWPSSVAENANEWCIEHLSDGGISEARIDVAASGQPEEMEITSVSGKMDIEGITVDYLPPMPKVRNASGVGVFDLNSLTIDIAGGEAAGVSLRGGTAKLYDFGKPQEMADIDLSIAGPIPKILALIDHPPLGYAKAMDLNPKDTGGGASGRVRLRFPLIVDLPLDRLRVSAQAKLEKIFIAKIALGANVTDGTLTLDLTEKGMDVTGPIVVEKTPAKIVWRENFETGAAFDTRLDVDIATADVSLLSDLKFSAAPVIENHVKGPVGVHVLYVAYPGDTDTVEIKVDAKRSPLAFPYFGWKKEPGIAATGEIAASLRRGRLAEVSRFVLKSQGFDVEGSARYAESGDLAGAKLSRVAVGRTRMEGSIMALADGGWDIVLKGESFDIGPLIDALQKPSSEGKPVTLGRGVLSIAVDLDTVVIDPKHPIKNVNGTIVRENDLWSLVRIDGRVGSGDSLGLKLTSGKDRSRVLEVRSSNAGDTLRSLGVFDHMIDGKLKINGRFNDAVPGNPLTGRVKVTDYRIIKAPGIAKVLSIMALTGILDQLRGKGIGFAILSVPFTLQNDALDIHDGRASGTELGMTAAGRVANGTVNIKGTIVPFFAVNSLLGKIPVLGEIFSGGEKGGGVFAARYSMVGPMDDPEVTVNPLSMLTPGFLRNLFNVFDTDGGASGGNASPPEPAPHHP